MRYFAISLWLLHTLLLFRNWKLVFQILAVLLFPLIWKLDGIWLSIVAAEIMAVIVTVLFLVGMRKKYHY